MLGGKAFEHVFLNDTTRGQSERVEVALRNARESKYSNRS